jgi:hypothetical protein
MAANMKRVYVLKNRMRFTIAVTLVCFALFTLIWTINSYGFKEVSYKTIVVKYGDTLWDIAGDNSKSTTDIRRYIYEIKKLNRLDGSVILPGDSIKIPLE